MSAHSYPKDVAIRITDHQARYLAWELSRRHPIDSSDRLAGALVDAQVDLNPHQVDAALFAFRSPFSKGAILADEVGLGKTIEAGLVLSQRWAERRRRLLVVTPASLRKQWFQELTEKFFLPCRILEGSSFNAAVRAGNFRPFEGPEVVICSYQFARAKAADLNAVAWDLVVLDEAHRLRNVYKPGAVIANTLKLALAPAPKLLLTATPLQNTLLELFGLVSFIDDRTFGDLASFREQYSSLAEADVFIALRQRLAPVCHRTLRRQVTGFVSYTRRLPLVQEFTPDQSEDRLYELVTEYLQRPNLQALPSSQRSLMTLVLRKLLASSTFAIAGALNTMARRLEERLRDSPDVPSLVDQIDTDYETLAETAEEWEEESPALRPGLSDADRAAIEREISDLNEFATLAGTIRHNAKGRALLDALKVAFAKATELGAAEKAIIFTESRRTQLYLQRLLADSPWSEGIVLFNGSNTDERSRAIYTAWLSANAGTDRVTGSRTADMRSALVDYFRREGRIMIATEAAAEGINLQFCSLVVNYDLPWNPQRIEQRIGRCHRYGQQHDVVVVNFLNRGNAADQRVFQLLSEKFQLFEGVFGASDEVLGALESGVDFERRIAAIYQECRHPEEIAQAFDQLQLELRFEIDAAMSATSRKLLENFDDEVREKLRVRDQDSRASLDRVEKQLLTLTRHVLDAAAEFDASGAFTLRKSPDPSQMPLGRYELPRRSGQAHTYRLNHPLAQHVMAVARELAPSPATIVFRYNPAQGKVTALEQLLSRGGLLRASVLTVSALDQVEEHIVLVARTDDGEAIEPESVQRLMALSAHVEPWRPAAVQETPDQLGGMQQRSIEILLAEIQQRNQRLYESEAEKLDRWADDLKVGLEREIKELERRIREVRKSALAAVTLEDKLALQKERRSLEGQRNSRRKSLFEAQDEIDGQRDALIAAIEGKLAATAETRELFTARWRLEVAD